MTSVEELPFDLLHAIEHANSVLNWQENVPSKDMPPPWMWPLDFLVVEWFDEVRAQHGDSSGSDEESTMTQNEFAKGRRSK